MADHEDVRATVCGKYADIATGQQIGCGGGPASDAGAIAQQIGYAPEDLQTLPEGASDAGFGDVEIVDQRTYGDAEVFGGDAWLREASKAVLSVTVRAFKPRD